MHFAFKGTVHQSNKNCVIYTPSCHFKLVCLYALQKTQTNDVQHNVWPALFYTMKVNRDQGLSCSKKSKKVVHKTFALYSECSEATLCSSV